MRSPVSSGSSFEAELRSHLVRSGQIAARGTESSPCTPPFCLLLIDLQLGSESGADIVASLRDAWVDSALSPHIVAVSGSLGDSIEQELSGHGFSEFLAKPVGRQDLAALIRRLRIAPSGSALHE